MFYYPKIEAVAFKLGPLKVHWYGLMYLFGFACAWLLARHRAKKIGSGWKLDKISDLIFYLALGVILGGRLGYILFYDLVSYLDQPLNIFKIWQGGMSFHGGLIGVMIAMWLYARHSYKTFFEVADFVAPLVPLGLGAGRIGNFINGELWGRVTDVPWAMIFPHVDDYPRHASQLYQAVLEGVVLFLILWLYSNKARPRMAVSGLFLLCYGIFRFGVEFTREPDAQLGFIAFDWLTMGQVLSMPMILAGLGMMWWAYTKK